MKSHFPRLVRHVVHLIPHGHVLTYGDVATLCGSPRAARATGQALRHTIDDPDLPWHRVINASGSVSIRGDTHRALEQIHRLRSEGIDCHDDGRLPHFPRHRWDLRTAAPLIRRLNIVPHIDLPE